MHPHRGFETITIVERGLIDHSDSYGGKGRYGDGDVQWMTAGAGIQHAEMFPLIHQDKENPLELFQIWLNLPKAKKFVKPAYQMIWHEGIKILREKNGVNVKLITGKYSGIEAPCPVPDSYASDTSNEVLILLIDIPAGATYELSPSVQPNLNRTLYMFKGDHMEANGEMVPFYHSAALQSDASVMLINGNKDSRMLLLQAKPINEPVVQRGPFVMNTMQEIEEAYADYRKSGFGGWPWDREDPVHGVEAHRFAQYADGIKIVKEKYVK
jgi:redox-sensitive bicupin YhaK (pirin superfamily)